MPVWEQMDNEQGIVSLFIQIILVGKNNPHIRVLAGF
jgi:hypothetical protein